MGIMLHMKQLSRILDGTEDRIVGSEIEYDWLHKVMGGNWLHKVFLTNPSSNSLDMFNQLAFGNKK